MYIISNCNEIKTKISTKERRKRKCPYAAREQIEQASMCVIKLPSTRYEHLHLEFHLQIIK